MKKSGFTTNEVKVKSVHEFYFIILFDGFYGFFEITIDVIAIANQQIVEQRF